MVKSSGASGEKAFGEKTGIVKVRIGDFEVPTEANGQMWIKFTPETRSGTCRPGRCSMARSEPTTSPAAF